MDVSSPKALNNNGFITDIINGMFDWVRVLDREDNILYVNATMAENIKNCVPGKKCFEALGRSVPCTNCVSRKSVFDGESHEKEEIIGERVFSVLSSPVRNAAGEVTAVVEVLRDVTQFKKLHLKLQRQNEKLENDLALAKKLQCRLLPAVPKDNGLDFAYIYKPCEKLGGDFIDIFKLDNKHTGIYIADVSGHGVSASMLTVFLRSTINKKTLSPAKALKELYHEFGKANFDPELYITVFYAVFDEASKSFIYSNAGHNVSPIAFSRDRFDLLRLPGTPISCWVEEPSYKEACINLNAGDRVFLYTDGITELRNALGEQFGEERLLTYVLDSIAGISETLNIAYEGATEFAELNDQTEIPDDITIALLEVK